MEKDSKIKENAGKSDEISESSIIEETRKTEMAREDEAAIVSDPAPAQEAEASDIPQDTEAAGTPQEAQAVESEQDAEAAAAAQEAEAPKSLPFEKNKQKKRKLKLYERTAENDIRFRGPLSYRHLKIMGWLCIICAQIANLISLVSRASDKIAVKYGGVEDFFSTIASMSVSLLLLANFALILNAQDGYKSLLIQYAATNALIFLGFTVLYRYYILGLFKHLAGMDSATAIAIISENLDAPFICFNPFLDLLLCTLMMYFLNGDVPKIFQGKRAVIFRMFFILPMLYEIICICFKADAAIHHYTLPIDIFPLLPTKPPITLLVFVILALFIKVRERLYLNGGKSRKDYQAFLRTNANSLHFSVFSCLLFIAASILDFILVFVLGISLSGGLPRFSAMSSEQVSEILDAILSLGFGDSLPLFFMAPLALLFSYTKTYKNRRIDLIIPLAAIVIIILIYFHSFYLALCSLSDILLAL